MLSRLAANHKTFYIPNTQSNCLEGLTVKYVECAAHTYGLINANLYSLSFKYRNSYCPHFREAAISLSWLVSPSPAPYLLKLPTRLSSHTPQWKCLHHRDEPPGGNGVLPGDCWRLLLCALEDLFIDLGVLWSRLESQFREPALLIIRAAFP